MRIASYITVICLFLSSFCPRGICDEAKYEWRDGKWVRISKPVEGTAAGELEIIRQYVKQGETRKARKAAEKFVKHHPDSPGCEEALMLAGQAEFNREHYFQAFEFFQNQVTRFPNGQFFERALLRMHDCGNAFLIGKKKVTGKIFRMPAEDDGIEILSRVVAHAPGSKIAEKALLRVADHHYWKKEYALAVIAYDEYIKMFPKSAQTALGMLRTAKSAHALYDGSEYEETPLIEAAQRYRAYAAAYPEQAKAENVQAILKTIYNTLGKKMYHVADFYKRTGKLKAAIFTYKKILVTYPGTTWASKASVDLRRLGVKIPAPKETKDKKNTDNKTVPKKK